MNGSVVAALAGQAWIACLTLILLGLAAHWLRPKDRTDLKNDRGTKPED